MMASTKKTAFALAAILTCQAYGKTQNEDLFAQVDSLIGASPLEKPHTQAKILAPEKVKIKTPKPEGPKLDEEQTKKDTSTQSSEVEAHSGEAETGPAVEDELAKIK